MGFVKRFGEFFSKNSKIFFSLQDLAAPLDIFYCSTLAGVCQEVSQTFYTNYYPDLTDKVLPVGSVYLSAKIASSIAGSISLTFAFNVWLYNVVYYVYFLYFLKVARPRISWATPS